MKALDKLVKKFSKTFTDTTSKEISKKVDTKVEKYSGIVKGALVFGTILIGVGVTHKPGKSAQFMDDVLPAVRDVTITTYNYYGKEWLPK